jgi:hypothetical protein
VLATSHRKGGLALAVNLALPFFKNRDGRHDLFLLLDAWNRPFGHGTHKSKRLGRIEMVFMMFFRKRRFRKNIT